MLAERGPNSSQKAEPSEGRRGAIVYSRCVLRDAVRYPALETINRELAANAAMDALSLIPADASPQVRAQLIGRVVEVALDAGYKQPIRLITAIKQMRTIASDDLEMQAYAAGLEGRTWAAMGEPSKAIAGLQNALILESQRVLPSRAHEWYLALAAVDPERRRELIHAAYMSLESVRPLLPLRDPITDESTFALRMKPVFEAELDLDLAEQNGVIDPAALERAQNVLESFREAELRSVFGSDCIPARPRMLPRVLRNNEIVLYPILLGDRVELLYATGGDNRYHRLKPDRSLNRTSIVSLIENVRDALADPTAEPQVEDMKQLYDALIRPIADKLGPDTTLVIIPDGPLRMLPLAALSDGNGGLLISRTRVVTAPALSYVEPGNDATGRNAWTVAAYLDRRVEVGGQVFAALAATRAEANDAVAGPGRAGVVVDDFDDQKLGQALSNHRADVLHLATHATFEGRSDRSFLVTTKGALPLSKLRAMVAARHERGEEIELLVLSACDTAVGDDEASMGLAGSAVQAGARSALASLWSVNDPSTAELMKEFYARYRSGVSRAEALRAAQLKIQQDPKYRHPYYWAGFTLIGAWR